MNTRPQFRVFGRASDEESGAVWWTKEATFPSNPEAQAFADHATAKTGRRHVVRGPGEPKPKAGTMSPEQQARELRASVAAMCPEERAAYFGR